MDFVGRYFGVRQANSGQARLDVLAKSDFEILARLPNLCDTNAVQRASRPLKEASGHARAAWTEPHAFKQVVELAKCGADEIHHDSNHCLRIDRLGRRLLNSTLDRFRWGGLV